MKLVCLEAKQRFNYKAMDVWCTGCGPVHFTRPLQRGGGKEKWRKLLLILVQKTKMNWYAYTRFVKKLSFVCTK